MAGICALLAVVMAGKARYEQQERRNEKSLRLKADHKLELVERIREIDNETDAKKWARLNTLLKRDAGPLPGSFKRNKDAH